MTFKENQKSLQQLEVQLNQADSYDEWRQIAVTHDSINGKAEWKLNPVDPNYDYQLISNRLDAMRRARQEGNLEEMLYLVRSSLLRNLADMGTPSLYNQTKVGTKKLIEDYIEEVTLQLNCIMEYTDSALHSGNIYANESDGQSPKANNLQQFDVSAKLQFFQSIRQLQGRTALLLSGGAMMGLIHVGIIRALIELRLMPRIVSGSSVGSLMAAIVGTKEDGELIEFMDRELFDLNALEDDFIDNDVEPNFDNVDGHGGSVFIKLNRLLKHGVLFDVEVLKKCIINNIGEMTFQEAYNKTRRILNITVSSSTKYEMPRLLNYLTAPNVLVWSAVAASCAIPFVYKSAPILARDRNGTIVASDHLWIDGSVENDLPMTRLSELFNVNHFIVSQVNPHVVPFLSNSMSEVVRQDNSITSLFSRGFNLIMSELQHRLKQLIEMDILATPLHHINNILSQKYYGDITIVPTVSVSDYVTLISNPTKQQLWDAMKRGQRATWQKENIIRNHCQLELYIDECIYRLRCQKLEQDWKGGVLPHKDITRNSNPHLQSIDSIARTSTMPSNSKSKQLHESLMRQMEQHLQLPKNHTINYGHHNPLQQLSIQPFGASIDDVGGQNISSSKSDDGRSERLDLNSSNRKKKRFLNLPMNLQMSSAQQQLDADGEYEQELRASQSSKTAPNSPLSLTSENMSSSWFGPEYDTSLDVDMYPESPVTINQRSLPNSLHNLHTKN
ncbi:hypothetical protein MIR68_011570 [Amoeboaphelidium protococcarum]|nr:hypothetical protein MIR68_011570 [Amoeboaphelidium protococcarum]